MDKQFFEISAVADADVPADQFAGPMLRPVLEDRFRLRVRTELRDTPIYELRVAPGGHKLKESQGSCLKLDPYKLPSLGESPTRYCGAGTSSLKDNDHVLVFTFYGIDLPSFARTLITYAGRPVIDSTGLGGTFDIRYEFARPDLGSGVIFLNGEATTIPSDRDTDPPGVSVFTALTRQLGLVLIPRKTPLPVLVIDRAEMPSPN